MRLRVSYAVKAGAMIVGILNAPVLAAGQKFEVASVKPVRLRLALAGQPEAGAPNYSNWIVARWILSARL